MLCSSANELQWNSNASSREDYIPQILAVLWEIHCIYIWLLWLFTGLPVRPSHKFGFRSSALKSGLPGKGRHESLVLRNNVLVKWFHMIFSCTDRCTDTFCTLSPLLLKNPQGVVNLKKAICVVHRSHSIIFLFFEFKSVRWCWRWETQKNAHVAYKPKCRSRYIRFTPKDDCERQVWNARAASWTQRENYQSM